MRELDVITASLEEQGLIVFDETRTKVALTEKGLEVIEAEQYGALTADVIEYTPEQIEAMEWEAAMNNLAADEWDKADEGHYG